MGVVAQGQRAGCVIRERLAGKGAMGNCGPPGMAAIPGIVTKKATPLSAMWPVEKVCRRELARRRFGGFGFRLCFRRFGFSCGLGCFWLFGHHWHVHEFKNRTLTRI